MIRISDVRGNKSLHLCIDPPLEVSPMRDTGSGLVFFEDKNLGILVFVEEEDLLRQEVEEDILSLWQNIACENEDALCPKTKEVRGNLLARIKEVPPNSDESEDEEDLPPGPAELEAEEDFRSGNFRSFESLDEFQKHIDLLDIP
jgi:hypothetical protein